MSADLEGFGDLDAALALIEKRATRRNTARRALIKFAAALAERANDLAQINLRPETQISPLKGSYRVGTRISARARRRDRAAEGDDRDAVTVYVGSTDVAAPYQEFGTVFQSARPHFRPAWDWFKARGLEPLSALVWAEIQATLQRAARRAARLSKKQ